MAAFLSGSLRPIPHLMDAAWQYDRPDLDLAVMLDPQHYPAAVQHGPAARDPVVALGEIGLLIPRDREAYLVRVKALTEDGRPVLSFIRSSAPADVPLAELPETPAGDPGLRGRKAA